jgi:hypothetical protein
MVGTSDTENEKSAGNHGLRSVCFQLDERSAKRRAGAHHVIDHCHAFTPHPLGKRRRKQVARAIQSGGLGRHHSFRETELGVEGMRDELGEKGAAEERAADDRHIMRPDEFGQCRHERGDAARLGEQRVEIEPQLTVVTGLEPKVAATSRDQLEKRGFFGHDAAAVVEGA